MKRKNLSSLIRENACAGNKSGKLRNDSGKKRRYGYDDLRDCPFGIMEPIEDLSDEDVERIMRKIRELDDMGRGGDESENKNRDDSQDGNRDKWN